MSEFQPSKKQKQQEQEIKRINKNPELSIEEKRKRIQEILTRDIKKNENSKKEKELILDKSPSYNNQDEGIFGCKHYKTGAKIKAACCSQLYPCRLCHDEQVTDHRIDRHATQEMMCFYCQTIQPVGQNCIHCKKQLSRYYCDICKFHDDDPTKNIFHCPDCGICRIGKGIGIDVFHCKKCGTCLGLSLKDSHICIENNLRSNCPICHSDLFSSREGSMLLKCGHAMHTSCFHEFIKSYSYKCPLCGKSIADLSSSWQRLDQDIAAQPMLPEYAKAKCEIYCNDCEKKTISPYHFLGLKCQNCGSYNTAILKSIDFPKHTTHAQGHT